MAEEASVIRGINWRETFPFTHIFRGFRVAIHPSKLILALLLLLAMYVGGRVLDALWAAADLAVVQPAALATPNVPENPLSTMFPGGGMGAVAPSGLTPAEVRRMSSSTEVAAYQTYRWENAPSGSFADVRANMRQQVVGDYATTLINLGVIPAGPNQAVDAHAAAENSEDLGKVKDALLVRRDAAVKAARDKLTADNTAAAAIKDPAQQKAAYRAADDDYNRVVADAYTACTVDYQDAACIKGQGIFAQFFEYEVAQINAVVSGVVGGNWLGGLHNGSAAPGVIQAVLNFCTVGPLWVLRYHTLYFILFTIWFVIIWALFGGAVARIAAVHVARDEKIGFRQALRFSSSKFLSFIFAPIIPLLIVLFVGVVVAVVALIGTIPWVGAPLVGVFFFLALGAAFVMTLVLIGVGGGFNLMYPTIAVEGSDSFDAISRSFSYIYARPWRMIWYTMVAVAYGALTFGFVRFFVFLMLFLVHYFVGAGFFTHVQGQIGFWHSMWPWTGSRLSYDIDYLSLPWYGKVGAFCVAFWVYLLISLVGAYAISFYFSANTIIYYLMRREVDATELDDVYLEQADEDFADAAAAGAAGASASVTVTSTSVVTPTGAATVVTAEASPGGPSGSASPEASSAGAATSVETAEPPKSGDSSATPNT